jgi:hypothetical protein
VSLDDLAETVVAAAKGDFPRGTQVDLVEPEARPLPQVITTLRAWLGFGPGLPLPVPNWSLRPIGWVADRLGMLGWRSPLRSTALTVLQGGVTGDPSAWAGLGRAPLRSLDETLAAMPATVQERWFARLWLVMPLCVAMLSLFWIVSGVIGAWQLTPAAEVLTSRGYGAGFATASVLIGAAIDIALGCAILWRPWARLACFGMIAVTFGYLAAATALAPDLWLDPLGVLVKTLPAALLALVTAALLDTR